MKDLESKWIQMPEDIRAVYGHKYLEKFQVHIDLTNDSCLFVYLYVEHSYPERFNPLYGLSPLV
jgi:hypothetical protein